MKKFVIAAVLIATTTAFTQTPSAPQSGSASQQKVIKDPAEYNAYITATGLTDPNQKAAALESFVTTYPNSVVKEDALAAEMAAYQQAGNAAQSAAVAQRVLQANPNNVPALVVSVYGKVVQAKQTNNMNLLMEAGDQAARGLPALDTWTKPEGMADADFTKQKTVFGQILNNAAGTAALNKKDYAAAQKYFLAAVTANPTSADDTYNLALSYLSPRPMTDQNMLNGLWYLGKALNLVGGNAAAEKQISDYGKSVYRRYHGADDGYEQFLAQVKAAPAGPPPADLATMIKKAPSPAEQVRDIIAKNPDIKSQDFGTWVLILTYGDQQTKDTAFAQIKDQPFKFQGQVISSDANSVDIALTQDAIEAKKAEVKVMMEEPFKKAPAAGSQLAFQANPASYTSEPFLITMDKGIDLSPASKKAPVKKAPPAKRPVTRKKAK
jgi:tetratricopeptide (TPR) repeat protein